MEINQLFTTFMIEEMENDKVLEYWLDQSLYSLPLMIKSKFYNNPKLLAMISFFKCFQNLECSSVELPILYSCYTQSATLYFLKQLERNHMVKIANLDKGLSFDLHYQYSEFGYSCKDKLSRMYYLSFYKNRSFTEEDIPFIKFCLKILNIEDSILEYKMIENKLAITIKLSYFIEKIVSKELLNELKRKDSYEKIIIKEAMEDWQLAKKRIRKEHV